MKEQVHSITSLPAKAPATNAKAPLLYRVIQVALSVVVFGYAVAWLTLPTADTTVGALISFMAMLAFVVGSTVLLLTFFALAIGSPMAIAGAVGIGARWRLVGAVALMAAIVVAVFLVLQMLIPLAMNTLADRIPAG